MTRYRALEKFGGAVTLVSVRLETGRTHQIRVHFADAGHPVLGDPVYRRRGAPAPPFPVERQMLHARVLGFAHPETGRPVRAVAPIPTDFSAAVEELRRRARSGPSSHASRLTPHGKKKTPRTNRGVGVLPDRKR